MNTTIKQVKSAKNELECQILDLLQSFENVHGVSVGSINVIHGRTFGRDSSTVEYVQAIITL